MINETDNTRSIGVMTEQVLNSISVLHTTGSEAISEQQKSQRKVLRSVFRPIVLSLIVQGVLLNRQGLSLEDIVSASIERPEMPFDTQLANDIQPYMQKDALAQRDWLKEATSISIEGDSHPLDRLSQAVIARMDLPLRQELTKLELSS